MARRDSPARWPADIRYLRASLFHASATPAARDFVKGDASMVTSLPNTYPSSVAIRPITDPTHPAHGQYGLFATCRIKPDTRILDYFGEIHCDTRPDSDYDLSLHRFPDGTSIGIDARGAGNEARFINDYRGISKKPNAVFQDNRVGSGELRMSICSCKEGIRKGDEIVVSYGKSWWKARMMT
ncbi:hypothetical protein AGABI1DRAFT_66081 [Agaricus bisporus var. burnettii JB137-S8]|uniref:SET domain-containing protein n=1 Tax=Agaricus bisporus var. burnettii (strain JB137-S8 / ATCC MYA-4627 / FGSC 10392) TaxID=597362 RepID=K5W9B3_AGABU|nr:uncharacterized protein AGABI1DRAFT_66081 [Agaricus bisporus var. burnettii JB137-S8]EKM83459.1 hypothetical protein AGABI1DRAFT_66081 [Agaricus bisporus var. burnettii JB137-S8]